MENQTSETRTAKLLHEPIGKTLISLAVPMAFGIVAIVLFNIVDTFYVGRLGAKPLAAMGFTFPVSFIVMSIAMGFSLGTASNIARAIGEGHQTKVQRLTTDALGLAVVVVTFFGVVGLTNMKPIFSLMGADAEMLELISDYMIPWFLGIGLLVIPMVGNGAIRATGDTKTPALIMIIAGLVNIVLDPFLIFGIGPFPRLELRGAALATVISWGVTFVASLWILGVRERMIQLPVFDLKQTFNSWKQILYISIPAAGTNVLEPLSMAIITRMVSEYGEEAVAAFGVGGRLESLALIGISALSTAITPFVGQNFGASNCDRIRHALRLSLRFSLVWGLGILLIFFLMSGIIAPLFNDDADVIASVVLFLHIIPLSYGAYGISWIVNSTFNAVNRPLHAALIIILHLFVFVLPLAYLGSTLYGLKGIFIGIALGNVLVGIAAYLMVQKFLAQVEADIQIKKRDAVESIPG